MFYLLGCVAALCLVGADDSTPIFHIDGNPNGAGDVNAIFFYGGYYHVMSQYVDASGTCTGWGHAVSSDMANWTRLENALACGPGKFDAGGVWDGSMTFLDAKTPIIFYDACLRDRRPHARARGARSGAETTLPSSVLPSRRTPPTHCCESGSRTLRIRSSSPKKAAVVVRRRSGATATRTK